MDFDPFKETIQKTKSLYVSHWSMTKYQQWKKSLPSKNSTKSPYLKNIYSFSCIMGIAIRKFYFFEMPEKSRFFRTVSLFRRNFLRQLPSAFDLRNQ